MNLYQALQLFQGVESDFIDLWEKASTLARMGGLTVDQRRKLSQLRDDIHSQQWWVVNLVRRILRPIPGAGERIPNPRKFPDLPATGSAQNVALRGATGLGAVPVVFVVAGVILAAIVVIAGAYVLVENWQITMDQQADLYGMRSAIEENRRRFDECLSRGGNVADCSRANPVIIFPPRSTRGDGIPGWAWAAIGVGGAALLLGGLYIYGASSAPRIERGIYSLPERVR